MLETIFPRIQANFGVSKVYFVCHSKGGLDLQLALATPQWIGIANAVLTFGTPNQGDALADWLFLTANGQAAGQALDLQLALATPQWIGIANAVLTFGTPNQGDALADWLFLTANGQAAGQALGLLTPAIQSLETANVLNFRKQWDPIFQNAQIPFYTVAGDVCSETATTNPSQACMQVPAGTGTLLLSLTGGTKSPANDGLVTVPETYLPSSYAMDLGVELENHYQLRLGDNSFSMIYGRVIAQENQQPGFNRVATNGFGDAANTEAWSMAWFNGQLYVGTGRDVYCVTWADAAVQSGLPNLYPPAIGDCNPDYHLLALRAEIWQYTPQTNIWVRVFQSPNSLTTTSNTGATVATAREMGVRSLTVVNEPGGVVALYAGTVTSAPMMTNHALGAWPPPRILRSTDGVTWNPLPQDPGTFLGDLSTASESDVSFQNYGIRSGDQLNGVLYLQVGDFAGVGRVIGSVPGMNPNGGNNNYQYVSPPAETLPVWILQSFNGFMYAGTGNPYSAVGSPTQYGLWKTDGTGTAPYTWTPVINENGAYAQSLIANYAMSMQIFADPTGCPATAEAYVWYEGRRAGLGEDFLSSVDACLESIRRRPEMCPVVHEGYRRSLIRRFPYAVFYEQSEATVAIYAVFHTSRDPDKWRHRLP